MITKYPKTLEKRLNPYFGEWSGEVSKGVEINATPAEFTRFINDYKVEKSKTIDMRPEIRFCTATWDESVYMLNNGWSEGVKELDAKLKRIEDSKTVGKSMWLERDTVGDFFDPQLVVEGNPEPWYVVTETDTPQKEIDLAISVVFAANRHERTMMNRGAAIIHAVNLLRKRYYVNLRITSRTKDIGKDYSRTLSTDFTLNVFVTTNNFFSQSLLAYYLANPAMLRRSVFALEEYLIGHYDMGCHGSVGGVEKRKDTEIVIDTPTSDSPYSTPEEAMKTIKGIINRQAVDIVNEEMFV